MTRQRTIFDAPPTTRADRATDPTPERTVNRWGDPIRVWHRRDRRVKIVKSSAICGVALPVRYKVIAMTPSGEYLRSRHRKLVVS